MKKLQNYIVAGLLIAAGAIAWSANNMGDNFSTVVRRPRPNTEFVQFAPTGGMTATITWTSSLNRVSGFLVDRRATAGTVMTNNLTCTNVGSVFYAVPVGAFQAGTLNIMLVE